MEDRLKAFYPIGLIEKKEYLYWHTFIIIIIIIIIITIIYFHDFSLIET